MANALASPFWVYYYENDKLQCGDLKRGGACCLRVAASSKKQIASIRSALDNRIKASPETKQHIEQIFQCPACGKGTMMTILVLDGHGNVVKEVLPVADTQQILMAAGFLIQF